MIKINLIKKRIKKSNKNSKKEEKQNKGFDHEDIKIDNLSENNESELQLSEEKNIPIKSKKDQEEPEQDNSIELENEFIEKNHYSKQFKINFIKKKIEK